MQDASHDCFKWLASGIEAVALLQDCMTEICMGCKNAQKPKTGPTFGVQKGFEKSGAWEEIKSILCCGAIFWTPKSGSRFCAFFHTLCEILLVAQLRTKSLILIRANQDSIVHDSQLSIRAAPTHPRTMRGLLCDPAFACGFGSSNWGPEAYKLLS